MRKTSDNSQEAYPKKHLTSNPQNCQGHQKKKTLRNCHSQEEAKDTWLLNAMWYPGWDLIKQQKKDTKTEEIWIKYKHYVSILFH